MIKIAIPTKDKHIDDHFGHCAYYTVYTISDDRKIKEITTLPSPEGCGCKSDIAAVMEKQGISLMLAGNMGEGAKKVLEAHHISVIRGCSGTTEDVINAWLEGRLEDSGQACHHREEGHSCAGQEDHTVTFKVIQK